MRRCPECRRDYYDDSLLYCLEDGVELVQGSVPSPSDSQPAGTSSDGASREEPTAILAGHEGQGENATALLNDVAGSGARRSWIKWIAGAAVILVAAAGTYFITRSPEDHGTSKAVARGTMDNFLRAKVLLASENPADIDNAAQLMEKTVAEDPDFAAGWALLARAFHIKAFYFADGSERKRLNVDAEVAVEKALSIDPELADAHLARGLLLWSHSRRFPHEQAIQSYKRAIALDPRLDDAYHQLGLIYLHLGLFDKAQAQIDKALEINPGNAVARLRYGVIAVYQGRYQEAHDFFKSQPPDRTPSIHALQSATALFKLGRVEEADSLIEKYLREFPRDEGGLGTSIRAMLAAKAGKTNEAERAIVRADEIGREFGHFHHTAYNIAAAYAMLNKPDKAVEYLQLTADEGFPCYPLFEKDDSFASIREYPAFVALLAKMKVQWNRYNATL